MTQMQNEKRRSRQAGRHRPQAVVALPLPLRTVLSDPRSLRWLARGRLVARESPQSDFACLLAALELPVPAAGLAALRLWGQSGERPGDWIAGADPVWLQAGLDKLYLHPPPADDIEHSALRSLFRDLQQQLLSDRPMLLQAIGECGYLRAEQAIATASLPAGALAGEQALGFLPQGEGAGDSLALGSELQMAMHDHAFNRQREADGRQPLNALWFWGGGRVPDAAPAAMPPLFSDDPLLRGFWLNAAADSHDWPGSLDSCLAEGEFVAQVGVPDDVLPALSLLRAAWQRRQLRSLRLLFTDGRVDLERGLRYFLRRRDPAIMRMSKS